MEFIIGVCVVTFFLVWLFSGPGRFKANLRTIVLYLFALAVIGVIIAMMANNALPGGVIGGFLVGLMVAGVKLLFRKTKAQSEAQAPVFQSSNQMQTRREPNSAGADFIGADFALVALIAKAAEQAEQDGREWEALQKAKREPDPFAAGIDAMYPVPKAKIPGDGKLELINGLDLRSGRNQ